MNIKIFTISTAAATILMAASPMVSSSMSTDNGGTKKAIDAYSDGAGVLLINQSADTKFDNSTMNKLVFKYGDAAKAANTTLKNQVSILSSTATAIEKADAATKLELAKVVVNPPSNGTSCDDANPQTVSDIWTSGLCAGNNIEGLTCDDNVAQTINDAYHNGICIGTNVEGLNCDDTIAKTVGDKYISGVCVGTVALACKEIKQAINTSVSGLYTIYPDGLTGMSAYCDMVTDGGGWTVVGNSFANASGDTSTPFNVTYATLVNSGVGLPGIAANYFMPMAKYQQMANSGRQVEHTWYAKSANASSPFVKTLEHSNHYLDGSTNYYTWHGSLVYAMEGNVGYDNVRLSATDYDNDNIAGSCVANYGSFGWYTTCHNAHFWSKTPDWSISDPINYDHNGRAVANGYSNYGPDAAGAFNTWYQLKIMIR